MVNWTNNRRRTPAPSFLPSAITGAQPAPAAPAPVAPTPGGILPWATTATATAGAPSAVEQFAPTTPGREQFFEQRDITTVAPPSAGADIAVATPEDPIRTISTAAWVGTGDFIGALQQPAAPEPPREAGLLTEGLSADEIRRREILIRRKDAGEITKDEREFLRELQLTRRTREEDAAAPRAPEPWPLDTALTSAEEQAKQLQVDLAGETRGAVAKKRESVNVEAQRQRRNAERAWRNIQAAIQNRLSFSGFGRSSIAAIKAGEIETDLQAQITAIDNAAALELQMFEEQRKGADADRLNSFQQRIDGLRQQAQESAQSALGGAQTINRSTSMSLDKKINNIVGLIPGIEVDDIDRQKSAEVGFIVNKDGFAIKDPKGNIIEFDGNTPLAENVESFAQWFSRGQLDFDDLQQLGLGVDDLAKVLARAGQLAWASGAVDELSRIKARNILWSGAEDSSVDFVASLFKSGMSAEQVRTTLGEGGRDAATVAANQKLFDDLGQKIKLQVESTNNFNKMNAIMKDFFDTPPGRWRNIKRVAAEQALSVMFQKMLDPGSVVREGEFARTRDGQSFIAAVEGRMQQIFEGGTGLTEDTIRELVNSAEVLNNVALDEMGILRREHKELAPLIGAEPELVDRFFDLKLRGTGRESTADDIFGTDALQAAPPQFSTSSWFSPTFNQPDLTGWTKGQNLGAVASRQISGRNVKLPEVALTRLDAADKAARDAWLEGILVSSSIRSQAEQQRLFAKGRTSPGAIVTNADGVRSKSNHQLGRAVDVGNTQSLARQAGFPNARAYIDAIEPFLNQAGYFRPQWATDSWDFWHFELA